MRKLGKGERNMELLTWAKTMLSMYKYLDIIGDTIDELVKKEALGSFGKYGYGNTIDSYNRIINLNARKVTLINLKVLVEDVTDRLSDKYARLIQLHFFENFKSNNVASAMNISIRTFFRRKNQCISKFANTLKMLGYTDEKLSKMFEKEMWFMNALQYNSEEHNEEDDRLQSYKLLRAIGQDFKRKDLA